MGLLTSKFQKTKDLKKKKDISNISFEINVINSDLNYSKQINQVYLIVRVFTIMINVKNIYEFCI